MSWVLRALVLLAATMPVFAATQFHPLWWQILIAAAIGSALGQLAVRATRGRRIAQWVVTVVAVALIGVTASLLVRRGAPDAAALPSGMLVVRGSSLTWDDAAEIAKLPSVEFAVPSLRKTQQVASEDQNWSTSVVGTTADYLSLMDWHLAAGEPFDATPFKAVVLGDTVAKRLFAAGQNPVGETVRIRGIPFQVVGVLARRGLTAQGQDLDDVVLMSVENYQQKIATGVPRKLDGILFVSPKSRGDLDRLEADVRSVLRDRHLLGDGTDDDFVIRRL